MRDAVRVAPALAAAGAHDAAEQAAALAGERARIAQDLHDDLGAKLLTIVHTSESERISTLAREALEEMRLSVRGLEHLPSSGAFVIAVNHASYLDGLILLAALRETLARALELGGSTLRDFSDAHGRPAPSASLLPFRDTLRRVSTPG